MLFTPGHCPRLNKSTLAAVPPTRSASKSALWRLMMIVGIGVFAPVGAIAHSVDPPPASELEQHSIPLTCFLQKASADLTIHADDIQRFESVSAMLDIAAQYHREDRDPEASATLEQAVPIAQQLQDDYGRATTLRDLADQYLHLEMNPESKRLVDQSLAATEQISDPIDRVALLTDLAHHYADLGEPQQGETLLAQAQTIIDAQDDSLRPAGLIMIATTDIQLGRYDAAQVNLAEALRVAEQQGSWFERRDMVIKIVQAYIEVGEGDRAQQVVDSQSSDPTMQITVLQAIAEQYHQQNQSEAAMAAMAQAVAIAPTLPADAQEFTLVPLVYSYIDLDQPQAALQTVRSINTWSNPSHRDATEAYVQAALGEFNDALTLLQSVSNETYWLGAVIRIAALYADHNNLDALEQLATVAPATSTQWDGHIQVQLTLGRAYLQAGQDEAADRTFADVIREIQTSPDQFIQNSPASVIGEVFTAQVNAKRYEGAIALLQRYPDLIDNAYWQPLLTCAMTTSEE